LVSTAALLFLGASWRTPSMQLLLAGLAATFGADMAYYAVPSAHGQALGDVVYLLALTCFALAALHPSMRAFTDPAEETAELDNRKKLTLLGFVLGVPPIVLLVQDSRGAPLYLSAVITAFIVLVGIVML